MPPPEARTWVGARHPRREHLVEAVAQAERHALQHRPRQVAAVVAHGQADERAARQRDPGGGSARRSGRAGTAARRCPPAPPRPARPAPRSPSPGASASRNQRRLPAADSITVIRCHRSGHGVAEGVDLAARVAQRRVGRGEDHARRPERQRDDARRRPPRRPTRVRRLVAAARHDRRAVAQPRRRGGLGRHRARHLGTLERRRQPAPGRSAAPSTTSADQSRAARSNRSVPAPSALSSAYSPVSRMPT